MTPVDGFGSTDCRCRSHLFYCRERLDLNALKLSGDGQIAWWTAGSA
ncbi:MAG: hypothetical protein AAF633_17320 [Chloroflexota bacterium]